MIVVIDKKVYDMLEAFYEQSRRLHCTLTEETCRAKIDRLEAAMYNFQRYAHVFCKEPVRKDWKAKGYYEMETEDFHFAYRVYGLPNGEEVLRYHDAVHSLLNH